MRSRRSQSVLIPLFLLLVLLGGTWFGCSNNPEKSVAPPAPQGTESRIDSGTAILDASNPQVAQVMAAQERHTLELMALPDVVGTGTGLMDDGRLGILVFTRTSPSLSGVPAQIDGVPTQIRVVGEVVAMASYKGTYRPVPGGVSVGNDRECAAGTIGCTVVKSGTPYALSNNHVFARVNAATIGERIDQPGRYDAKPVCSQTGQIGVLSDFVPISFRSTNVVDAAIAAYTTSSVCSMVNNLYTPSSTTVAPSVGLSVKKVGRTSGLTRGTIAGINVTINVSYGSPGVATFVNQIYVASNFIRSGDSGSLMVTDSGNNPVGLNFAGGSGSSFANPIGPVLQAFGATVCGQ